MIYAYGICEAEAAEPPPRRRGLGDARLRVLRGDGLAAVYSRHRSLRPRPSPEAVLVHERVLEALMERGPVLPLRFGTRLEDEEELAAVLAERQSELARALERVRGRVELGLRVLRAGAANGRRAAASGRDYLMAKVQDHREAERMAREVHEPLAALARESRVEERPSPPAVLVASYLVDEDRIEELRERAAELAAGREELELVVTGPWAPYSFTEEER